MGLDPLDRATAGDNRIRDSSHLVDARGFHPELPAVKDIRGDSLNLRDIADGKVDVVVDRAEHLPELVHARERCGFQVLY